jgi:hypothetical protein
VLEVAGVVEVDEVGADVVAEARDLDAAEGWAVVHADSRTDRLTPTARIAA